MSEEKITSNQSVVHFERTLELTEKLNGKEFMVDRMEKGWNLKLKSKKNK